MNKVTIQYPSEQVQNYIRHAIQNNPHETVVLLVGDVEDNVVKIKELVYPAMSKQHEDGVAFTVVELDRVADEAYPLRIVGTIHSQPNCSADPSEQDIRSAARAQEVVFGILGFQRASDQTTADISDLDGWVYQLSWYVGMPEIETVGI